MKFYFRGIIWDKDRDKPLCEAKDGVFETEDSEMIGKLQKLEIPPEGKEEKINKGIIILDTKTGDEIVPGVLKAVAEETKKQLKEEIKEQQLGKKGKKK